MTAPCEGSDAVRRPLDHAALPMRLWHKAKKLGTWDPQDVDFDRDARDWAGLDPLEQDVLLHLTALFQAGEEAVTRDLLPLVMTLAGEGRLEEQMYLTSFLWEEAKHVEVFRRFLDEVARDTSDLARYQSPAYRRLFGDALPTALGRLRTDASPEAQAVAAVTYHMIVEGVMAETGHHAYHSILQRHGLMPGMQQAIGFVKRDESRHLAFGVYLLSRLVAEHGDPVWRAIERRMDELLPTAIETIQAIFARYERMPFGLAVEDFVGFATTQFQHRLERIEGARTLSLADAALGRYDG